VKQSCSDEKEVMEIIDLLIGRKLFEFKN